MSLQRNLVSGVAGAVALNATHETLKQVYRHAPHVDFVGMRALGKLLRAAGREPRNLGQLHRMTLAADLLSNAAYYSVAVGVGSGVRWKVVWGFGLAAGLGAAFLPPLMGLGNDSSRARADTTLLTIAYYTIGALTAGAVASFLNSRESTTKSETSTLVTH